MTAYICYHNSLFLSSTFLNFFVEAFQQQLLKYTTLSYACQQLFSKMLLPHFAVGVYHITPVPACQLLFRVKKTAEPAGKGAEKEGFEPSRRLPDLHP